MELSGKLGYFSVSEILYLLSHFKKTGKLEIKNTGEIYFVNGKAVHAVHNSIKGIDALYNLSLLGNGEFVFTYQEKAPEITIEEETSELFNEIEKRTTAIAEIEKELPPLDTIPVKSQSSPEEKVALRKTDWKVLIKVNGKNTIKQIVEESGLGFFEAMKTLSWLFKQNLIYDPEWKNKVVNNGIKKVNKLLLELGEGPWLEEIKKIFANTGINDYITLENNRFELRNENIPLSIKQIDEIFEKCMDKIKESATSTLGRVLALKKIKSALKEIE